MKNLLLIKPASKIVFLICYFFVSNIQGQTWVNKAAGYSFWSIDKDIFGNIYAGTTGSTRGIFKSSDGGNTFTNIYSIGTSNYLDIACDSSGRVYVANASNGVIYSTDGGQNFNLIPSSTFGSKTINAVACGKNGFIYAGATTGGVWVSTDFGATFTNTALQTLSIVSFLVDKYNSNIIYAGSSSTSLNGFYRSTDAGFTFSTVLNPVNVWSIIQTDVNELFTATTTSGYPFHRSTDGGLTWTLMSNMTSAMRGGCADLVKNIYTSGNGGVFKTTDKGLTFTNFNFTVTSNQSISFQNKILVASSGSTNGGVWVYIDETIPVELNSFSSVVKDGNVFLNWSTATETNNKGFEIQRTLNNRQIANDWQIVGYINGNGTTTEKYNYSFIDNKIIEGKYLYRLKQIDFDGRFNYSNEIEVEIVKPSEFILYQNYPNPFFTSSDLNRKDGITSNGKSSTTISFLVPFASVVNLKIYDINGNEVASLVNELKPQGKYNIEWRAANIPSGIYLLKLQSESFIETKKIVLLK